MSWFTEYDHIGYDLAGNKLLKPTVGDEIDEFLQKNDNPDYWYETLFPIDMNVVNVSDVHASLSVDLVVADVCDVVPFIIFFGNECS